MGRNAIHRLGHLLQLVDEQPSRRPVLDGCEYREALQAVFVGGGVAGNVVPDRVELVLNHRFAPDRSVEQATAHVQGLVEAVLEDGDRFELVDGVDGARPGLDHPLMRRLITDHGLTVQAKLGWTDVAVFAAHGVPAVNLGPGDPLLAHTAGERVERGPLERVYAVLHELVH
jgi:succinyl-diaminopimelate desuccinylase